MNRKPVTPYQRLLDAAQTYAAHVEYPSTGLMWVYEKAVMGGAFKLSDLAERVAAAEQLGYDVKLVNRDGDLQVFYVKKMPSRPWEFK
jgi:hypothetical protein